MKTPTALRAAMLACGLFAALSLSAAIQASFYVDPVSGSDSNNGTSPGTAFATLARARTAVDAINGSMTGDIMVYLMPGDHVLTSTLQMSEADSGTNGHEVIWLPYGERGSARVLGGLKLPLTGQSWTADTGGIYKTPVPSGTLGALRVEAIFENGVRGRLGRHPDSGYYSINAKDSTNPKKKFQWKSGDTIPAIATPTDVQVLVWPGNHDWSTEIHDVAAIDRTNRWITFTTNLQLPYLDDLAAGSRYYLQGARELVNQPGEFYYDSSAGQLYYYPRATPIANQEIIIPTLTILINGTASTSLQNLNGLWQFEDDTSDTSIADNNGTATGDPAFVTSRTGLGDALELDGATQWVTVPNAATLEFGAPANPFTVAAWIKTSDTGIQPIVCKARPAAGADNMDYKFWLNASGLLEFARWNVSNSINYVVTNTGGTALNDGNWHHVAFVNESATSHKLYVDGSLATTNTTNWAYGCANDQDVEIGRYRDVNNNITYLFAGDLDDARVYKSALAATDIADLYSLTAPAPTPVSHITFTNLKFAAANFDYTNAVGGGVGMLYFRYGSNLTFENNEITNGSTGIKISGGANNTIAGNTISDMALAGIFCDGIQDTLITNNHVRNTGQFYGDPGSNIRIDSVTNCTVSHNNLSTSKRHGIRMRASTGTTISFNEVTDMNKDSQDTGAIYWGYADDNTVTNNRVHHSGDSFGQQHGLYVEDGSDRTTITNNIIFRIGNAVSNGATAPINVKGVGNLIQNNIFDFSRSHAGLRTFEIASNAKANSEKVLYNIFYSGSTSTTFYDFQSYANNRIAQSDYNVFRKTASGSNVFENIPGDDTLANWKTILSNKYDQHSTTADPGFTDPAAFDYSFTGAPPTGFTPIATTEIGLLPEFIYPQTTGQWIFAGSTTDITLNGHNGTKVGGSYVADRNGHASSALLLNGSSDYVAVADDAALDFGNPANPFTIVAWVKTTATSLGGIVAKARDSGTPSMDYRLRLLADGTLDFSRYNAGAAATDGVATSIAINNGAWHHVAFVNEGASSHKLYIDGVLAATSTTTWTYDNTNSEPVRIGRDRNGSLDYFFNGSIDDVAILQRALTENDILDLNHLPHP